MQMQCKMVYHRVEVFHNVQKNKLQNMMWLLALDAVFGPLFLFVKCSGKAKKNLASKPNKYLKSRFVVLVNEILYCIISFDYIFLRNWPKITPSCIYLFACATPVTILCFFPCPCISRHHWPWAEKAACYIDLFQCFCNKCSVKS